VQLLRLLYYTRLHCTHTIEVISLHLLRHLFDALGCQQFLADRIEQNGFDSVTSDPHGVLTCAAVVMTRTPIAALISNRVVRAAGIAHQKAGQQELRPAARLEPLVILRRLRSALSAVP